MGHSTYKKMLVNMLVVLITSAIMLVMLEGIVRLRQYIKYGYAKMIREIYYTDQAQNLRLLLPNVRQAHIQTNSLGFRSPELANPKPASTIRIAFLGASTTFCAEVSSNEMTWPYLVWKRLQAAKPDAQFDYVNAGVPGYILSSISKMLAYRVKSLQPDIIVIYEATNDLSFDTRKLAFETGLISQKDFSNLDRDNWFSRNSLLWQLIEKNLKITLRQRESAKDTKKLQFEPQRLSQDFKHRLTALIKESQETAALVAVATFSYKLRREQSPQEKLNAANTALYYMPYMSTESLLTGYEEYNRVIREVAAETGALLIDGELSIPGDNEHFNDSVHFKDAGSELMAARVSEQLLNAEAFETLIHAKQSQ